MPGASLEFDLGAIERRFAEIQARLSDLTPLMEEIGSSLNTSTQQRFESKIAPDGKRWAAHAASTIRVRLRANSTAGDILVFSGTLSHSVNYRASSNQVIVSMGGAGNSTAYARAHQFGASISRKGVNIGGYTITLPARPVLGISADDEKDIKIITEDFLRRLTEN